MLFADEEVRAAAVAVWRSARNGVNDFLRDLDSVSDIAVAKDELSEQLKTAASRLGTGGDRFLDASRKDLRG